MTKEIIFILLLFSLLVMGIDGCKYVKAPDPVLICTFTGFISGNAVYFAEDGNISGCFMSIITDDKVKINDTIYNIINLNEYALMVDASPIQGTNIVEIYR